MKILHLRGDDDDHQIVGSTVLPWAGTIAQKQEDQALFPLLQMALNTSIKKRLNEREQKVVGLRFGLNGGGPLTLRKVGKIMGVSGERVRQIEVRAIKKLRRHFHVREELIN